LAERNADMFKRAALLGVLALFITCGIATSTASAAGPYWHVAGARLEQGVKQLKLQSKGPVVFTASAFKFEIECKNGVSEGAAIEGNGTGPGQDKGRFTFTQCAVLKPVPCTGPATITTVQTKSILVKEKAVQTGIEDRFEPTQGETFFTLNLSSCGGLNGPHTVIGQLVAEIIPKQGIELQEGLFSVDLEVGGLRFDNTTARLDAVFGSRLATNEPFGVFET
jgi:hypothetical protein